MKEWLTSLIAVGAISALAAHISPTGALKRPVRFALALLLLTVLLAPPLGELRLPDILGTEEGEGGTSDAAAALVLTAAAEELARDAERALGMQKGDLALTFTHTGEGETLRITEGRAEVRGRHIMDEEVLRSYLSRACQCEWEIVFYEE